MNQYSIFIIVAPISALITLAVLLYARVTYPSRETRLLSWLMVSIMGWLIFNSLEVIAKSESNTLLWAKITYIFIATTPLAWLAFALRYAAQERWLALKRFIPLAIVPTLTLLFALTNDWHMFLWKGYHYISVGNLLAFKIDRGPWFYVHMLYSYGLTLAGAFLILDKSIRSVSLYRKQSLWLAIGALTPIVANMIYVFNIVPGLQKDYTPVSFALASIAFIFGMLRYRLFELHPIARDMVVNGLSDAVFVLDEQNRVVDLNPTALDVLGSSEDQIIGQPARVVFAPWKDLMERFANETEMHTEISIGEGEATSYYDLRLSTLWDQEDNSLGRLIVLREITQLKKIQQALLDSNRMLEAYASAVALDFKEPTQIILGSGKLLLERKHNISEESTSYLIERVISNAEHLSTITNELLGLAKSDEEKYNQASLAVIDLTKVIKSVLDEHEHNNLQIAPALLNNAENVIGNPTFLREILRTFFKIIEQHAFDSSPIKIGLDTGQKGNIQVWLEYQGEGIAAATTKVQILVAQRMAARMNGQANLEQVGADRWKLWINLQPAQAPSNL